AHREGRGDRPDRGPGARCRRLRDQALLPARGGRPGPRRPSTGGPSASPRARRPPRLRRPQARRAAANGSAARRRAAAHASGVRPPVAALREPGHDLHAGAAPVPGLGRRLGRRQRDGHRPHPPAPAEDRRRPVVPESPLHRVGRRLPVRAMRPVPPLVLLILLCALGALGTMAVGATLGMHAADLATLAAYLLPALLLTVLAVALANRLLAKASLRQRFVLIAVAGTVVSLGNLFALTR